MTNAKIKLAYCSKCMEWHTWKQGEPPECIKGQEGLAGFLAKDPEV